MLPILVGLLVISQILCFYFIAILNAKVTKFKDLEVRQNQLIREMEDTISLYLVEIREENDRFINELSTMNTKQNVTNNNPVVGKNEPAKQIDIKLDENIDLNQDYDKDIQPQSFDKKVKVPKAIVQNAYNQQKVSNDPFEHVELKQLQEVEKIPQSFEEQVMKLHNDGKTVEEIAKITKKGKTEIELLIKFNA